METRPRAARLFAERCRVSASDCCLIPQQVQVLNTRHGDSELPLFVFHVEMSDVEADDPDRGTLRQSVWQGLSAEIASHLCQLPNVVDPSPCILHGRILTGDLGHPPS